MMTISEWRLIPGVMTEDVGLPQVLQDDVHHFQDVASGAWILGDPWDRRHAKAHQNLGNIPNQDCQSPNLSDAVHLEVLEEPPELDELHQLLMIVSRVESLRPRFNQRRLA
jgi:hypothetical protein